MIDLFRVWIHGEHNGEERRVQLWSRAARDTEREKRGGATGRGRAAHRRVGEEKDGELRASSVGARPEAPGAAGPDAAGDAADSRDSDVLRELVAWGEADDEGGGGAADGGEEPAGGNWENFISAVDETVLKS